MSSSLASWWLPASFMAEMIPSICLGWQQKQLLVLKNFFIEQYLLFVLQLSSITNNFKPLHQVLCRLYRFLPLLLEVMKHPSRPSHQDAEATSAHNQASVRARGATHSQQTPNSRLTHMHTHMHKKNVLISGAICSHKLCPQSSVQGQGLPDVVVCAFFKAVKINKKSYNEILRV